MTGDMMIVVISPSFLKDICQLFLDLDPILKCILPDSDVRKVEKP